MNHPAADQVADLVAGKFRAGEHGDDARHGGCRLGVDALDPSVCMRRADERGVRLAGSVDVVGVMALAGDESLVLLAAHGGAHSGRAHVSHSLSVIAPLGYSAALSA